MTMTLSPGTQAAYRREWELFADWCTATDRAAMPADPATAAAYLAETASVSTRRRRAAALTWAHRLARLPTPIQPAPRPPDPGLAAVDTGPLLALIPLWGWPAGMFGRRDAMLVILRFDAALTLPAIATLTTDRIRVADQHLIIDSDHGAMTLPPAADTRHCPACVWLRWRALLLRIRRYHTAPMLRQALGTVHDDPRPAGHRCTTPATSTLDGPVMLPINQWGAAPLPRRPPTPRALSGLAAAHLSGFPPHHRADTEPADDHDTDTNADKPAADQAPTAVAEYREPYELVHQRGLAARHQAITTLQSARTDIDDVDRHIDELQDRINALTSAALDLRDRIPTRPGGAPRPGG